MDLTNNLMLLSRSRRIIYHLWLSLFCHLDFHPKITFQNSYTHKSYLQQNRGQDNAWARLIYGQYTIGWLGTNVEIFYHWKRSFLKIQENNLYEASSSVNCLSNQSQNINHMLMLFEECLNHRFQQQKLLEIWKGQPTTFKTTKE